MDYKYKRDVKIAIIFLLVLCCSMVFAALLATSGNEKVTEYADSLAIPIWFTNLEKFTDSAETHIYNLNQYANIAELSDGEYKLIEDAITDLEQAVSSLNKVIALKEVQ